MAAAFTTAFVRPSAFGTLAAVHLPEGVAPVSAEVLETLLPEERAHAATLSGRRQIEFTGGRLAWRLAGGQGALLSDARGQPVVHAASLRMSVSVSHKNDLALALVGDASEGTIGIDLEGGGREPLGIASKVLRPEELEALNAVPAAEQWARLVRCFALKEATYKAIHPYVRRYVSFYEARVSFEPAAVELFLREGPELVLEAALEEVGLRVLALVRARVKAGAGSAAHA